MCLDHGHLAALLARGRGHFEPDPAAAHDQQALAGRQGRAQRHRILDAAQGVDARQVRARDIQAARPAAVAQDQLVVARQARPGSGEAAWPACRCASRRPSAASRVSSCSKASGFTRRVVSACASPDEHRLGQRRPLVGTMRLVADQDDPALEAFASQRLRGPAAGLAGAHDHDGLRAGRISVARYPASVAVSRARARRGRLRS